MLTQKFLALTNGGSDWVLYLLLFLSVCSVAVMIERFISLRGTIGRSRKITERAKEALKANDLRSLEELSRDHEALEGRLLNYALKYAATKGSAGIEEIMNGYILMERPQLEKNLSFLATLGNNAPFVGLLGTVLGVVRAFADLAGSQGNPSVVMAGLSTALVSTAVGLFVAIPAVAAYNYFQRQVRIVLQNAESIKQLCMAYALNGSAGAASAGAIGTGVGPAGVGTGAVHGR